MPETIDSFFGKYRWLSNFHMAPITLDGKEWPSVEHYYQAMKSEDKKDHEAIRSMATAGQTKKAGKKVKLRADWDIVKREAMFDAVHAKFIQHPDLREKLLATGDAILIEGNTWGDVYWGVCRGTGANHLGKLLMRLRAQFKAEMQEVEDE